MMNKNAHFLLVILGVGIIFLLGGCTKQQTQTADAAGGGIVELSLFLNYSWITDNSSFGGYGTPESRVRKEIEEKTGVRLNITNAKTDDYEQINLLIASNDLPDMVSVDYLSPVYGTLSESDMVTDLMPLIKQYAPDLIDTMGQEYWNYYKSDSGINNFFANCAFSPKSGEKYAAFGGWCPILAGRNDIWEALGEPDISTPEKFKQHLVEVRNKYPNVKPLLVGASNNLGLVAAINSAGLNFFKAGFGIEAFYEKSDGSITTAYNHPEYVNFLTWINELFREGFITREELAGTDDTIRAMQEQGNVYLYVASIRDIELPPAGNPNVIYHAIPPMGKMYCSQQSDLAWVCTFLSKKCKNPDAAIKLLAYLATTEGDRLNQWGQEGVDYEYNENGSPVRTAWYNEITSQPNNRYNAERGFVLSSMNWGDHEWINLNVGEEPPYMHRARMYYQDHYYARLNFLSLNPTGNSMESILLQQCRDYFDETIPKIIMADSRNESISIFNEMKATLNTMGIDRKSVV
jgi:ABC-type glycerol-3-phosphate transport system substrate-binding protein